MAVDFTPTLLQYFMAKGCVTIDEFKDLISERLEYNRDDIAESDLRVVISKLNVKIEKYHMMIRQVADNSNREVYFVLISSAEDSIMKAACLHDEREYELFRLILETIVKENRFLMEDIGQLASKVGKTRQHCENLTLDWVKERWFNLSGSGNLTLGVRSTAELDVYINKNFKSTAESNQEADVNMRSDEASTEED